MNKRLLPIVLALSLPVTIARPAAATNAANAAATEPTTNAATNSSNPTATGQNPSAATAQPPIDYSAAARSGLATQTACAGNISGNCINSAAGTLGTAGVKLDDNTSQAVGTIAKVADLNPNASIGQLKANCSNLNNPTACASSSQQILNTVGGLNIPWLSQAAKSVSSWISQSMGDLGKAIAGIMGGNKQTPSNKQINDGNPQDTQKVAAAAVMMESSANQALSAMVAGGGDYPVGASAEMRMAANQAIATSISGAAGLQSISTKTALASGDSEKANAAAADDDDSSLDALNKMKQIGAAIARGQERNYDAGSTGNILQAGILNQMVDATKEAKNANDSRANDLNSLVARNGVAACYIASITNPNACQQQQQKP